MGWSMRDQILHTHPIQILSATTMCFSIFRQFPQISDNKIDFASRGAHVPSSSLEEKKEIPSARNHHHRNQIPMG